MEFRQESVTTIMNFSDMTFEFGRKQIIEKVKENREKHIEAFKESMRGYHIEIQEQCEKAIAQFEKVAKKAEKGKTVEHKDMSYYIGASKPESHQAEYDRAIAMFEMARSDLITLNEESFARYVRDEWDWKDDFIASNSYYSSKTALSRRH